MTCFHTIRAWKLDDGSMTFVRPKNYNSQVQELQIPCGKCIGCALDKSSDWACRCWCEMQQWENNCFITLTYNNENLPEGGYLVKKDLQDFMKRLRYYHKGIQEWTNPQTGKKEYPIRFLACGEYGPGENSTHRPHYHILIFNWKPQDKLKFYKENHNGDRILISKEITDIWGKGFTTVGDLTYKSACYVARYCTKKMFKGVKHATLKKALIEPEFILMSRNGGIGIKYWKDYQQAILKREGILIKIGDKVKNRNIPKYFEKKYKENNEKKYERYKEKKIIKGKNKLKEILSKTSLTESEYKLMQERKLQEKAKILKRSNII